MSSTRPGHRPPRRSNPVLQAAAISGACAIASALIGGLFSLLPGGPSPAWSNTPARYYKAFSKKRSSAPGGSSAAQSALPLKLSEMGLSVNPHVPLDGATFCSWRFGRSPMPLASVGQPGTSQPTVHIDARCVYPDDPSPMTGAYFTPAPIPSALTTQIANGSEVTLICYTEGRTISDIRGNVSSIWLEVEPSSRVAGYIPDINVGGGYTQRELRGLGLSQCAALVSRRPPW
jgi:hypothetical protein